MSTQRGRLRDRARADAGTLACLAGLALLAWVAVGWQPGQWDWTADPRRWLTALALLAAFLGASAALYWRRRKRRPASAESAQSGTDEQSMLLLVFASQTGHAEALAVQTSRSLTVAGTPHRVVELESLSAERLVSGGSVLFIVSTSGEGDAPDHAARFVRQVLSRTLPLRALRYGVLALGDRQYRNFCAFGRQLDHWLHHCGAHALFDRVDVDNGEQGALRHWQHHLGQLTGASDLPDWVAPSYSEWILRLRELRNPGSQGGAVFHLELVPVNPKDLDWQAGDIAEVGPRHARDAVANWLHRHGWDGARMIHRGGRETTLFERLASSQWPETVPHPDSSFDDDWISGLTPLPHREYSIASVPGDGALHLLVRQYFRPDGSLGLGSAWLTRDAAIGERLSIRIRGNRSFRLPDDDRPLILVGNGTGIAGLRALMHARIARGHRRNWLVYGERQLAVDNHYASDLERWQSEGFLSHLDLTWSRDGGVDSHAQDALRQRAPRLRDWIAQGASILVCGSLRGLAGGVDRVLHDTLGTSAVDQLTEQGRYRRDVY